MGRLKRSDKVRGWVRKGGGEGEKRSIGGIYCRRNWEKVTLEEKERLAEKKKREDEETGR